MTQSTKFQNPIILVGIRSANPIINDLPDSKINQTASNISLPFLDQFVCQRFVFNSDLNAHGLPKLFDRFYLDLKQNLSQSNWIDQPDHIGHLIVLIYKATVYLLETCMFCFVFQIVFSTCLFGLLCLEFNDNIRNGKIYEF